MYVLYILCMGQVSVNLIVDESLLKRVDDYRFANRIKSRLEALRLLIERGLEVKAGAKK